MAIPFKGTLLAKLYEQLSHELFSKRQCLKYMCIYTPDPSTIFITGDVKRMENVLKLEANLHREAASSGYSIYRFTIASALHESATRYPSCKSKNS